MLSKGTATQFNPTTGTGSLAIIDPFLYANPATRSQPYTSGTYSDHSTGLIYYHLIMQQLATTWYAQ